MDTLFKSCDKLFEEFLMEEHQENRNLIFKNLISLFNQYDFKEVSKNTTYKKNNLMYCYLAHRGNKLLYITLGEQSQATKLHRQRARQLIIMSGKLFSASNKLEDNGR
jgi:hypothetical protein